MVLPATWIWPARGSEAFPSGPTKTVWFRSLLSQTWTSRTSSGPTMKSLLSGFWAWLGDTERDQSRSVTVGSVTSQRRKRVMVGLLVQIGLRPTGRFELPPRLARRASPCTGWRKCVAAPRVASDWPARLADVRRFPGFVITVVHVDTIDAVFKLPYVNRHAV